MDALHGIGDSSYTGMSSSMNFAGTKAKAIARQSRTSILARRSRKQDEKNLSLVDRRRTNARVSADGANQLLLDVNAIKDMISKLPEMTVTGQDDTNAGGANRSRASQAFARFVSRTLLPAEMLLKLAATPVDIEPAALAANFRLYVVHLISP